MSQEDIHNLEAQLGNYIDARRIVALRDDMEALWPEMPVIAELTAYSNGRLPGGALTAIPYGRLEHGAAAAWNDMREFIGRRHGVWIRPLGPNSSYRTYSAQQYFWNLYKSGRGNLAAYPGSSNHGWGKAVDVQTPTMVYYIRKYGARFGWRKVEAFNEWWHYNYVGGYKPKPRIKLPKVLSDNETKWAKLLIFHRHEREEEGRSGKGPKWRAHNHWAKHYDEVLRRQAAKLSGKREHRRKRRHVLIDVIAGKYNI